MNNNNNYYYLHFHFFYCGCSHFIIELNKFFLKKTLKNDYE